MPRTKAAPTMQVCTATDCRKVGGPEVIKHCGSPITCAKRMVDINPLTDVVVRCDICDQTRAIPASALMSGKPGTLGGLCQRGSDTCVAYIMPPAGKPVEAEG